MQDPRTGCEKRSDVLTVQSHFEALARKHANLERQLSEAISSPSTDDATISEIKRRKLSLKDQIEGLRTRH
nr:DUF465 domain-containing protein [Rhizobium laguerreae]